MTMETSSCFLLFFGCENDKFSPYLWQFVVAVCKTSRKKWDQYLREAHESFEIWIGTLYPKCPPIDWQWLKPSANWPMLGSHLVRGSNFTNALGCLIHKRESLPQSDSHLAFRVEVERKLTASFHLNGDRKWVNCLCQRVYRAGWASSQVNGGAIQFPLCTHIQDCLSN